LSKYRLRGGVAARTVLVVSCLLAIAIALVVAVLSGHAARPAAAAAKPVGTSLAGTFTLWHGKPSTRPCTLGPAYRDVRAGTAVTVRDPAGRTVGTGRLAAGATEPTGRGCVFAFSVPRLQHAAAYTVLVGNRAALTYSRDQLATSRWHVQLNLGIVEKKKR
jgi:hypothetical protein